MSISSYIGIGLLVLIAVLIAVNFAKIRAGLGKLRGFFREVDVEGRKVTWPSREDVINGTILVGVTTFILTVMVGVVDYVFGQILVVMFK